MFPKKKSRRIIVDEQTFRFAISCSNRENGWYDFNVTIQSELHNGSKLFVKGLVTRDYWLDFSAGNHAPKDYPIITPNHIEMFIKRALREGWDSSTPGPDFILNVENERDLNSNSKG